MPYTITLATAAILVTAVVVGPAGRVDGPHADSRRELGANVLTIAGQSMPDFWTGVMLLTLLRRGRPGAARPPGFTTWGGLVLPTLTIAILQIALISRMVRREMVGNFAAPYLTVARSRGVSERLLTWRYAMGNSADPGRHRAGHPLRGDAQRRRRGRGRVRLARRRLAGRPRPGDQATTRYPGDRPRHGRSSRCCVQLLVDLCYPLLDPRVRLGKAAA